MERRADSNQSQHECRHGRHERSVRDQRSDPIIARENSGNGSAIEDGKQFKGLDRDRDHRFVGFQRVVIFKACAHNTPRFRGIVA